MKTLVSQFRSKINDHFNDVVGREMAALDDAVVRLQVKKIGGLKICRENREDLGDIDVLLIFPKRKEMWAIETKDFEAARTPLELSNEVRKLFDGPKSTVSLHAARVAWLSRNRNAVIGSLFGARECGGWEVSAMIVVSEDMMSRRLTSATIGIHTLAEAKALLSQKVRGAK